MPAHGMADETDAAPVKGRGLVPVEEEVHLLAKVFDHHAAIGRFFHVSKGVEGEDLRPAGTASRLLSVGEDDESLLGDGFDEGVFSSQGRPWAERSRQRTLHSKCTRRRRRNEEESRIW